MTFPSATPDIFLVTSWARSTVDFPIGDHVNVLSDYKETGTENYFLNFNTITAVMSLIC